jgi:hypothetical protein
MGRDANNAARLLSLLAWVDNELAIITNRLLSESIEILKAEFRKDMAVKVEAQRDDILKYRGFKP